MVEEFFKVLPTNTEENDYVIVCGNVQASKEHFKTVKAAQEYVNAKPWDLIFTIAMQHTRRSTLKRKKTKSTKTKSKKLWQLQEQSGETLWVTTTRCT